MTQPLPYALPQALPRVASLRLGLLGVALLVATACSKPPPPEDARPAARAAPAPPAISAEGGPYVLRYFSPTTGNLLVAKKITDVP